ncbi:hypothetical protein [Clostridium paraputrificum]|uniref:hypothetical protein n=1 Tax=Clostridium paraputrificum TaxID=29363 RepID=UPI00041A8F11|nr:hypothetical protein [Clostridium paraputrificum]
MLAMLYLYRSRRESLKKPYEYFRDTYINRIAPQFLNIEQEAEKVSEEYYSELGRYFNNESDDPGDYAELAWEKGLDYYEGVSLMKYNTKMMWISTVYQFWEQQVRKFLYDEISHTHILGDYKDFCTKGISDIKEIFLWFNYNLELKNSWKEINELRLVNNVIKHGDGWSARELQKIKPEYFEDELQINRLELYKNSLNDEVLNINEYDFERYCNSLIGFWDELPERIESIDE